ncbi:Protein of unknown function DUF227 [Trinorchestia longiramus]|nr:Protein of unknown function DUF227 [Trinorchestia longiramus]
MSASMSSEISSTSTTSCDSILQVLTKSVLQKTISNSVGPEAHLKSFMVKDFCSKGDNYTCYVTSVIVKYILGSEKKCASYVVKSRQSGETEFFNTSTVFEKEGMFYCELVPALNKIRQNLSLPPLKFPACFFVCLEAGQQLLLLEDMRAKSFQMVNNKNSLDFDHVMLVMKELAHLHATSVLLEEKMGAESFSTTFNFFHETFTTNTVTPILKETLIGYVKNGVRAAEKLGGYEELVKRLLEVAPNCFEHIEVALRNCDPKFHVVNHGDCWKNNTLFRYDENRVAEVCLVDLQVNRRASLAIDINHFLFSSLDHATKKNGLMDFLSAYFNAFKEVFDAAQKPMKFTVEELYKEYRQKNTYGVLISFMSFTTLGLSVEDTPDFTKINTENSTGSIDDTQRKLHAALDSNLALRERLVGLLEEIIEHEIY